MRNLLFLFVFGLSAALAASALPAHADRASADKCAAHLATDGKLIYAAVIGAVGPGVNLKDVVTARTRTLVMQGKIGRDKAPSAAQAAGGCLKQAL